MDRNSILALVLIFGILLLWEPYVRWVNPPSEAPEIVQQPQESIPEVDMQLPQETEPSSVQTVPPAIPESDIGTIQKSDLPERMIIVESQQYRGVISTKGGTIQKWVLNNFPDPAGNPVDIIRSNDTGNLAVSFFSNEGYQIDLADFDFIPEQLRPSGDSYRITVSDRPKTITLTADLGNSRFIRKRFTFHPDDYDIVMEIEFENCQTLINNQEYSLVWGSGIHTTETDTEEDMRFSKSMALYGSTVEKFDIKNEPSQKERPLNGDIHWIATRSKYFCSLVIPQDVPGVSVEFGGTNNPEEEHMGRKNYVTTLVMRYTPSKPNFSNTFLVYLGPVDYDEFKAVENEVGKNLQLKHVLDIHSWIRELSMLIHRVFNFLHGFIPNYGLVIIIFSLLINLIMFPLTAKSYKSMKKMQDLNPILSELKEKYKKEPQKMQQAQLKLYKEHKINPLGGCLPMLLQMPIFFSIYPIFRSIELRGAPFFWWIQDLSKPDMIASIPTFLPFNNFMYGNQVNVLTFIYAILLFTQQKIMMKDPKQKAMVYIMPIMLLLFLNRLSSGFILYFIIFLLLSITQRYLVRDEDQTKLNPSPNQVRMNPHGNNPLKKGKNKSSNKAKTPLKSVSKQMKVKARSKKSSRKGKKK